MRMEESSDDTHNTSRKRRLERYYAEKTEPYYKQMNPRETNWDRSNASFKGWINQVFGGLDFPYKSIALFAGSWLILECGWPLLIVYGIISAGTVWNIPTAIPCVFITVYIIIMISGMNMIRSIITQLGSNRDNLVKALFRGYFWSLLSIGLILLVHEYFRTTMPQLFVLPIFYIIPIEILGTTTPIPIPIGYSGLYMDLSVTIILYTIGVTGSSIGGIELLRNLLENSRQRGTYGAIFGVLLLAAFPMLNISFSLVFLSSVLDLFRRCLSIGG